MAETRGGFGLGQWVMTIHRRGGFGRGCPFHTWTGQRGGRSRRRRRMAGAGEDKRGPGEDTPEVDVVGLPGIVAERIQV